MNLFKIISEIEKVDPEVYDRLDSRRRVFRHLAGVGKTLAASAVPFATGAIFNQAYAQGTSTVTDVLKFALTLEYLEYFFYDEALKATGLNNATALTSAGRTAITDIRNNELAHVNFLRTALGTAAGAEMTAANFDFTAKGNFPDVFTNYATFLAVAQALEDTGVRAYKGQATNLMSNKDVLTAALNIHSAEARHASHIRTMRRVAATTGSTPNTAAPGTNPSLAPKSWITGNEGGGPAPGKTNPVYAGEENVTQANVNLQTALGQSASAVSESFDEPLTKDAVLAIAGLFIR